MRRSLAVLAALAIAVTASAAEFPFELTNNTDTDVVQIKVTGGTIAGFKRVATRGKRDFVLTMPDGVCDTQVTVAFEDQNQVYPYNACTDGGLVLGY